VASGWGEGSTLSGMVPNLKALAARLPAAPRTRFAPAPTGYLHLGHVVSAIHVWGIARALGASVVLRVEDHDRGRCRPGYEAALREDLAWLGFVPDLGVPLEGPPAPSAFRQGDCSPRYEAALAWLRARGLVYACRCSRRDIARQGPDVANEESRYAGTCRDLGLPEAPGLGLRVRMAPGEERFDDARLGPQVQEPSAQCGDLLVRDRLGQWTYQFAVAVDDLAHGIDLVIRGEDLLASTGRQLRLARLLGRTVPPVFLHHPLVRHPGGAKLSKANRDTGVRELRAAGMLAVEVIGEAAYRAGLQPDPRPLAADDLPDLFTTLQPAR